MRIRILAARSGVDGDEVVFDTAVGRGIGRWRTPKFAPVVGRDYDVEFQLELPLGPAYGAIRPSVLRASLEYYEDAVVLTGQVECVEEDGVAYLRLAPDCLILVDAEVEAVAPGEWWSMKITPEELGIFAIGC